MRVKPLTAAYMSEALLAQVVKAFYAVQGFEMFPEVVLRWFSGRPDFVGVKDNVVMAVECKKTLSYEVIEQLYRWRGAQAVYENDSSSSLRGMPHLLVAASFTNKSNRLSDLKRDLLKNNRFGYISVQYEGVDYRNEGEAFRVTSRFDDHMRLSLDGHEWTIRYEVPAKIQAGSRQTAHRIIEQLHPDMKRAVAGVSGKVGGNYSTPFRRTLMKAVSVLERQQPLHIKQIVSTINDEHGGHHYSSDAAASQGIAKFLREFEIATCEVGRPVFQLTPDYQDRIFASETASSRLIKERKAARERARAFAKLNPAPFWEKNH